MRWLDLREGDVLHRLDSDLQQRVVFSFVTLVLSNTHHPVSDTCVLRVLSLTTGQVHVTSRIPNQAVGEHVEVIQAAREPEREGG